MRIRQINHEAQRNDSVGEKVSHWKGVFREKGGRCSGARWDGGDAGDAGADDSAPAVAAICAASPVMHACVRGRASTSAAFRVVVWPWAVARAGEELRAAVEEWQVKRGTAAAAGAQRLTTAFLDGIYPIVDVYELKVGPADAPRACAACSQVLAVSALP